MSVLIAVVLLAGAAGGFLWLQATAPPSPSVEPEERVWTVAVEAAEPRTLNPTVTLYGRVETPRAATLTAAVADDVHDVHVHEGDVLTAGTPLIRLDPRERRLAVRQRQAELAEVAGELVAEHHRYERDQAALEHERELLRISERNVERARRLAEDRAGAEADVDGARATARERALAVNTRELALDEHESRLARLHARRDRLEALLEQANLDLDRTEVRAPFDGRVADVLVAEGDRVAAGTPLVELYDLSALEIRATIPLPHVATVRQSLAAGNHLTGEATVDGSPVAVEFRHIAGRTAPGSAGIEVLLRVTGDAGHIPLGRFATVQLRLPAESDAVAIPAEALYGRDRVYTVEDQRMVGHRVERLGLYHPSDGDARVLVRGDTLKAGAALVVTRLPNAMEGLRVDPVAR